MLSHLSNAALTFSQRMPTSDEVHVRFLVADGATLTDVASASCEAAVCVDVILYFAEKGAALREVARLLRPCCMLAFTEWEISIKEVKLHRVTTANL
ncbi:hypothetical protein K461DRAFT_50205 [Myriangium duriaei CBS 260.36]|uniref:Methyltransferase type 11 domain-containing protein n=1 Tax=Myriangium duriaei CBS 260.36 TaxID=1168546 RepID=A0A9P4IXK1_9PEZI|nr:hypothetical protein K461DRAFT_50205 [Myriangium duriaei CBS 260.36]